VFTVNDTANQVCEALLIAVMVHSSVQVWRSKDELPSAKQMSNVHLALRRVTSAIMH